MVVVGEPVVTDGGTGGEVDMLGMLVTLGMLVMFGMVVPPVAGDELEGGVAPPLGAVVPVGVELFPKPAADAPDLPPAPARASMVDETAVVPAAAVDGLPIACDPNGSVACVPLPPTMMVGSRSAAACAPVSCDRTHTDRPTTASTSAADPRTDVIRVFILWSICPPAKAGMSHR